MLHVVKPECKRPRARYLLINPPIQEPYRAHAGKGDSEESSPYSGRGYTYPLPIGLLRIAGKLLADGNEVYFLDCFSSLPRTYPSSRQRMTKTEQPEFAITKNWRVSYMHLGLRYEEIDKLLGDIRVDEVFVGCTFTYHNEPTHYVIDLCKKHMPQTRLTLGGIYPTLAPDIARTSRADELFIGPYPGTENQSLNYNFLGGPPGFILIKGTSGCPHRCAYCAVHKLEGNRFKHRYPDDVFEEIVRAHERYGLVEVGIWDSNILMQYNEYLGPILKQIIASDMKLRMSAPEGFDYRLLTPEIAQDLKQSGFSTISLALENVDNTYAREQLNRQNNIDRLKKAISYLRDAGFEGHMIRLFIIVGLPDQDLDNIIENIRFVWSLGCNVTLFPFTPIPGTQLYEEHLDDLHSLPLKSLHPSLYCCVKDDDIKDALIDLSRLGKLNQQRKPQADNFQQVLTSPNLIEMLS